MKHGHRFIDRTGQVFGRLIVKAYVDKDSKGRSVWLCICLCGGAAKISGTNLNSGDTKSCGCLRREQSTNRCRTLRHKWKHGHSRVGKVSLSYRTWQNMLRRAENRDGNNPSYANVRVCRRWLTFENFLVDVGKRPSARHSLSRFRDTGDYKKSNCAWHTRKQQRAEATKKTLRRNYDHRLSKRVRR